MSKFQAIVISVIAVGIGYILYNLVRQGSIGCSNDIVLHDELVDQHLRIKNIEDLLVSQVAEKIKARINKPVKMEIKKAVGSKQIKKVDNKQTKK